MLTLIGARSRLDDSRDLLPHKGEGVHALT